MKRQYLTSTNVSFDWLRGSADFLNAVLHNITCCVLLLDKDMRLQAFNDPLLTIFSNKKGEDLLYRRCGEAIGCAYQIEEMKDCGKTNHCHKCELRTAALYSYLKDEPVYKEAIDKPFFTRDGKKELKHLRFSTRLFVFKREKYILLLVEDVTEMINLKREVGLS